MVHGWREQWRSKSTDREHGFVSPNEKAIREFLNIASRY